MSWKSFQKDYFNFSRAERFGILVLCGCILFAFIIRWWLPFWIHPHTPDTNVFAKEIAQFRRAVDSLFIAKGPSGTPINLQSTRDLFYFDPNRTTDDEWNKLGLNERQIRNIRNYQASGGYFKQKEDLQKLYTISATQYHQLEPYIRLTVNESSTKKVIPEMQSVSDKKETEKLAATLRRESKLQIELNTADSSLLTQLPGVGPVLAARTVRYRNLIGGFTNVAQLNEVYGINSDLAEQLATHLTVDSSLIRKIAVNKATFRELVVHPYLNEQQVRGVQNFIRLQKRINSLDELVKNNILKPEDAEKIRPYLSFE
jgi:DNA uptake protein ComE-like DNA-binding protein